MSTERSDLRELSDKELATKLREAAQPLIKELSVRGFRVGVSKPMPNTWTTGHIRPGETIICNPQITITREQSL